MIGINTNVLDLYLPDTQSAAAAALLLKDPEWTVPRLWRSEFRSVLATYMRNQPLTLDDAVRIHRKAESLVADGEYDVGAADVLRVAKESGCPEYDCEFAALTKHLDIKLVSAGARLYKAFPERTLSLSGA